MRCNDLLWVLAYPVYQVIGTLRHEAGHALAAMAFGRVITEFSFLPTSDYWGYVRWDGPDNVLIRGAPYLLDLLTFMLFFYVCMTFSFRRRWIWLNLVIVGVLSPLINSAYNYIPNPKRVNDVDILLREGSAVMVHGYFLLTLLLYLVGLFILFTKSKVQDQRLPAGPLWTLGPLLLSLVLLLAACSSTVISSLEPEPNQKGAAATQTPLPSPVLRSATMTPAMTPEQANDLIFQQVVAQLGAEYPLRAPIADLDWEGEIRKGSRNPDTLVGEMVSGDWKFRLFDWQAADNTDAVDVTVYNPHTRFKWTGSASLNEIDGQLKSAGLFPEPDSPAGDWLGYRNVGYGFRFEYPAEVDLYELGVEFFDLSDVPDDMTVDEYEEYLIESMGPNMCVQLILKEAYIWIDTPENYTNQYNFCQRLGPSSAGWRYEIRAEAVLIEGQEYVLEGKKMISLEGPDRDESLRLELPSGIRIEVGVDADSEEAYQRYRSDTLPVLLAVLETFKDGPRTAGN